MRDSPKWWLVLFLAVGGALLIQCSAGPPASPVLEASTPVPTPQPTTSPLPAPTASLLLNSPVSPLPAPSATPAAQEDEYSIQAWRLFSRTQADSVQQVSARLLKGEESVAGAQMYALTRYGGTDHRYPEQGYALTNERGIASVNFTAADAWPEETVLVDVYVI
jgi:hypothetical protein